MSEVFYQFPRVACRRPVGSQVRYLMSPNHVSLICEEEPPLDPLGIPAKRHEVNSDNTGLLFVLKSPSQLMQTTLTTFRVLSLISPLNWLAIAVSHLLVLTILQNNFRHGRSQPRLELLSVIISTDEVMN